MSKSHDAVTVDYAIVGGKYLSRYIILFFICKDLSVINSRTLTLALYSPVCHTWNNKLDVAENQRLPFKIVW